MKVYSTALLAAIICATSVCAWDKDDHEIFRLRDELEKHEGPGVTFYDFLEIPRSAKQIDIDRAFRKRSRALHPDKARQSLIAERAAAKPKPTDGTSPGVHVNKPPTQKEIKAAEKLASERFTRLGLIADLLKDDRRRNYDHFLDNGFPKWRGTGYYYERFRPGFTSTILGLFVFSGGLLHYLVLVLGYKQQRDFVERYIRQARQAAWGNSGVATGVPGLNDAALGNGETPEEEPLVEAINRRDRRAKEKEAKRKGKSSTLKPGRANGRSGSTTPLNGGDGESGTSTPVPGARKRVEAENGKILVVDRAGNVFLEEEDEETEETNLLLLDPSEIEKPNFKQTFLYRLPVWIFTLAKDKVIGEKGSETHDASIDTHAPAAELIGTPVDNATSNVDAAAAAASASWQRKRKSKKQG